MESNSLNNEFNSDLIFENEIIKKILKRKKNEDSNKTSLLNENTILKLKKNKKLKIKKLETFNINKVYNINNHAYIKDETKENNLNKNKLLCDKGIMTENILNNSTKTYLTLIKDLNYRKNSLNLTKTYDINNKKRNNYYTESKLKKFYNSEINLRYKQKIFPLILKKEKKINKNLITRFNYESRNRKLKIKKEYNNSVKLIPIHCQNIINYTEDYLDNKNIKSKSPNSDFSELIPDVRKKKRLRHFLLFQMNDYYQKNNTHFKFH